MKRKYINMIPIKAIRNYIRYKLFLDKLRKVLPKYSRRFGNRIEIHEFEIRWRKDLFDEKTGKRIKGYPVVWIQYVALSVHEYITSHELDKYTRARIRNKDFTWLKDY